MQQPETTDNGLIPMVITKTPQGERSFDIYSRLLDSGRIVMCHGEIEDNMANTIIAQLLHLQDVDGAAPIYLYINSPGGSVSAGLAIYDTMKAISAPVHTVVNGIAMSMGAVLLAAGDHRSATPNSRIMIHQAAGGTQGKANIMKTQYDEFTYTNIRVHEILSWHCGASFAKVFADCKDDVFLDPVQAKAYGPLGLIDEVLVPKAMVGKTPPAPATTAEFKSAFLARARQQAKVARAAAVEGSRQVA